MGALQPPDTWQSDMSKNAAQMLPVKKKTAEYDIVVQAFKASLSKNQCTIKSVERIENHVMWQSYAVKLGAMRSRDNVVDYKRQNNKGDVERKWLFHGTSHGVVPKIAQQGFNRAFAGKNATAYGKGVYFAKESAYSIQPKYSSTDAQGVCSIFLCQVAVGDYCIGNNKQLTSDFKNEHETLHDSRQSDRPLDLCGLSRCPSLPGVPDTVQTLILGVPMTHGCCVLWKLEAVRATLCVLSVVLGT